ncbi:MAG: 16S rRNA (guanine(527)-N(7))-methyltransferase RsmG [Clostridia bacterium]|nr:16S rRNA (guanine(527)-N(7))-methyltransferase RsmG [Clostridia bacterium]
MINYLKKLDISISDKQAEQFAAYERLLLDWNEKINLTAITGHKQIMIKHFADSLTPVLYRDFSGKSLIDVGTGAGFPGLPLKIAVPSLSLTLLDSLNKRISFLETVSAELGLMDVKCIHSRAEDGGKDAALREKFDFSVSRAVAPLNVLAEYDLPFVKVGGEFIALKGPAAYDEIKQAENAVKELGGEISDVKEVILPDTELKHKIIFVSKVRQTPSKYPRKSGKAIKSPIV